MEEISNEDRVSYLKFVWGRNRLPAVLSDVHHEINYMYGTNNFPVGHTW